MKDENSINDLTAYFSVKATKTEEQAWEELQLRMKLYQPEGKSFRLGWPLWAAVAAVFIALIIVFTQIDRTKVYFDELSTSVAQTDRMILPDSSTILLASNSSITFEINNKNNERKATLKGEAYFDVNEGDDFIVEFDGGAVNVLGTEFSISAYDENLIAINCSDGMVKVNFNGQIFLLSGGQGIKLFNGLITGPFTVDKQAIADQTEGTFYWNKISLEELLLMIGYRFNRKIEMDENLKNRNFSGKIDLNKLEECLLIVSMAMDINFSEDENSEIIRFNEK
jgi:transmembrane sensor